MSGPHISRTIADLRAQVKEWRRQGLSVAMVPTMGALHDGHLSLMREALSRADRCIVSIFVNPTQFAPTEDLDKYPRQLERDLERLAEVGVQLAFTPSPDEVYPEGFATKVVVGGPSAGLETDFRPHFFEGVATVVSKLFLQATPDCAVFGQKDYQQLCVVRRMCRDLDIPVEIIGAPTVRDAHGLAMSSRNAYLDAGQLAIARQMNVILYSAAAAIAEGADPDKETASASRALLDAGFSNVDYVAVRESGSLGPWQPETEGRLLAAAWLGSTRLIDNVAIAARS
ncbi:pantoate--beta-alanine ligase [Aquamicrobium defluvii]|uniref:Pantothenate synthetase n=1 Tax=Aquamicrobium defluvii TaxID=69279 RepID=A0A4R6YEG8_9HYPH|nr:pantoate--beta-alanine ligase [Aquamicrobium defluvii]EZQ15323.1 pantoate--beta-alanine ligase [Halopseudomonas bauzanensis]TDR34580.1 pantothenate synthetase [Aquamicrobium defluvii]